MAVFVAKTNKMSLLSKKSAIFLARDGKMRVPSRKEAFFMAGVRDICYIYMI